MPIKYATSLRATSAAAFLIVGGSYSAHAANFVGNGGFQAPTLPTTPPRYCISLPCNEELSPASVPPWQSTVDIEIWTTGFLGVPAYEGNQFAEVNSTGAPPLFQVITGIPAGTPLTYSFAHRGRDGNDTVKLRITDLVTSVDFVNQDFTTGNSAWSLYTASSPFLASGNNLKFEFIPVFPTIGSGNLIDSVALTGDPPAVPGPSPLLGFGTMLGLSSRLRRRIKQSNS
jgi:hypothetical protein